MAPPRSYVRLALVTSLLAILAPASAPAEDAGVGGTDDPGRAWQVGLRAGYGLSYHGQGTLESVVLLPENDGPPFVGGENAYSKAIDEVDLALDVTAPCALGPARPFVTLGGGLGVGRNQKTGGLGRVLAVPEWGVEAASGVTSMTLEDEAHFYTRVGAEFAVPAFGDAHPPLHVRPFAGFEVRSYRAMLGGYPSTLPFLEDPPPDTEQTKHFTDVSPLVGAELVVPLADTPWGGLDVYLGGEYAFDVNGSQSLEFELEGATVRGRADGGNVARLFTGFQLRFDVGR